MPTSSSKTRTSAGVDARAAHIGPRVKPRGETAAKKPPAKKASAKKASAPPPEKIEFVRGSGNVFADLGLAEPEEFLAKAEMVRVIRETMKARGLNQRVAARLAGLRESDMSDLMRGKLTRFSRQRIEDVLQAFDYDIEIHVVDHRPPTHERMSVIFEGSLAGAAEAV